MNYLFIFTIGPVQSFIENSRKIRDMYAGSRFLSEIMNEAIQWIKENSAAEVIFPLGTEGKAGSNIPNRLIARFSDEGEKKLADTANALESFIRNYFSHRCIEILGKAGIGGGGADLAKKQLRDFLEVYWLYENYEADSYGEVYQRLFHGIQAVKGVRSFRQAEEPWGRKCALFPEYSAVFAKKNRDGQFPYLINREAVCDISAIPAMQYLVKPNESLSAIALIKRMYDRDRADWYSARLMLLLSRVDKAVFDKLNIPIRDEVANALYDMVNENLVKEEYEEDSIQSAEVLKRYIEKEHIKLSNYYALMKFDGDDMGRKFMALGTDEEQRKLSERISRFAKKAPEIIKKYGGLPGYAGGEDFYGFVPLDVLLQCLAELHWEFRKITQLTFSAGIAVAHLMQPLKDVAMKAEEMERTAKNAAGKNAFAIGIIKRSGETVNLPPYKMECTDGLPGLEDVKGLSDVLKNSGCSRSLIFNISHLFARFMREAQMPESGMASVLITDCAASSELNLSNVSVKELVQRLMKFYTSECGLEGFLHTLNGVAFLTREVI